MPENVRDFLRITNGFYINGKVFFSMINDNVKEISPRATNRTRDIIGFNRYYRGMTDIEDYIILGKDSISYFVYDIASEKNTSGVAIGACIVFLIRRMQNKE